MSAQASPSAGVPVLEDLGDVDGRSVLVRVDFNVPLEDIAVEEGAHSERVVADDYRIRASLPTLCWLAERGAKITVCSHLGRPGGTRDLRYDLAPVRERLQHFLPDVAVLDNLRFSPGEEANDPGFVDELVAGQDAFVNDAFSVSHRAHASVVGPPARLPSAGGRQLVHEVEVLGDLLVAPARPFVAVVGGAKISDKLGVLRALSEKVDVLAVGGAMAFTFMVAQGCDVGASLVDRTHVEECARMLESCLRILLPLDVVALAPDGSCESASGEVRVTGRDVPDGWRGLDIGPETARMFAAAVQDAATVLWNGPLGVAEDPRFAGGTRTVAEAVARSAAFSVVGGGDSLSALHHLGLAGCVDFLSTGGGASLELIEKGDLPGIAALRGAPNAPRARSAS